jgi:hypothetical protein
MLNEFIAYLNEQIGQPYLWGGQHTRLTPDTYEAIIHKREDGRGGYKDGTSYADASIAYCKSLFDMGLTVLYAYDCSGLGMYWLQNVKHLYKGDANANTMMGRCSDLSRTDPPKKGWWAFRQDDSGKATHIGYMVDDEWLVEAKGRKYGVVVTMFAEKDWSVWGIPDVFYDEIAYPEPVPPEPPIVNKVVKVIGKSVRIRKGYTTLSKTVKIAHRGDEYPFIAVAPSGWYCIDLGETEAYITNKEKYTKLAEI